MHDVSQDLNKRLAAQKADAERLLGAREADVAQLQCELAAAQSAPSAQDARSVRTVLPRPDGWQLSIAEAGAGQYSQEGSGADVKKLLEEKRSLQVLSVAYSLLTYICDSACFHMKALLLANTHFCFSCCFAIYLNWSSRRACT